MNDLEKHFADPRSIGPATQFFEVDLWTKGGVA